MTTTAQEAINAFSRTTPESSAALAVACLSACRACKDHAVTIDEVIEIIRLFPTDDDSAKNVIDAATALVAIFWDKVDDMQTTDDTEER